jgi:hypothetical protein
MTQLQQSITLNEFKDHPLPQTINNINHEQQSSMLLTMTSRSSRRSPSPRSSISNQDDDQQLSDLKWIMITNPHQSKTKEMMRNVRIQVMNDYLTKERRNPNSTDARVRHTSRHLRTSTSPEMRRKSGPSTKRSQSPRARDSVTESALPSPETALNTCTWEDMELESLYDAEPTTMGPFPASNPPVAGIGAKLDVFNATPKFGGDHIDVTMLKHNCMYIHTSASKRLTNAIQARRILQVRPCARDGFRCCSLAVQHFSVHCASHPRIST